jgi:hypothetical protein
MDPSPNEADDHDRKELCLLAGQGQIEAEINSQRSV